MRQPLSALDPAGPASADIANVWWAMFVGGTAIWLFMIVLAVYAFGHRRRGKPVPTRALLVGGGLVFPLVVVLLLLVYGIRSGHSMLPLGEPAYTVEVRGHQWWWEVIYPDGPDGPRYSANEIHVPAGRAFDVHVSTADVIHSFWAPRLGGKIDAIPGRTNTIRLRADEAGVYHGVCSEFCGAQHARMRLQIHAHEPEALEARLAALDAPPRQAGDELTLGAQAYTQYCIACHSLDPSAPSAQPGPNLADLGLRATLGAGTVPNGPAELRDWLRNHQAIKPGNLMPEQPLTDEEFEAVATFLEHTP